MPAMMSSFGYGFGLFWLHVHMLFDILTIVGFILLAIWAARTLAGKKLQSFVIWLLVIGIAGALLTVPPASRGLLWIAQTWRSGGMMMDSAMMGRMMEKMMEHDKGENDEGRAEMIEMMKR